MFAITGITGQVGGAVARHLLAHGSDVRAVVRDVTKGQAWAAQGCEVAIADIGDANALATAFSGADGVFILLPPNFDPEPDFPGTRAIIAAIRAALVQAGPRRVVALSSIGAQSARPSLLSQLGALEQALRTLPMPVTFLRPGWFIDNAAWDVEAARSGAAIPSFLQPLDRTIPMVATADVGRVAAELLLHPVAGVVELEGPARLAPNDIAAAFSRLLGRPVPVAAVPRGTWDALFRTQGMRHPEPRIAMLDGFNEGWIAFEGDRAATRKGSTTLDTVLRGLVADHDG